jgi:CRISPR-associated endonuclease Csn1
VAEVAGRVQAMVVSHKPDIGWQAALHNDTAYGAIAGAGAKEANVVVRRPLEAIATWSADDARIRVRDPALAAKVASALAEGDTAARKAALAGLRHSGGHIVRRVRTTERLDRVQAIADRRTGAPYKLVKRDGNHRAELWRLPDGAVRMIVVSTFEAAQIAEAARLKRTVGDPRPHPAAKRLMRLHKNDFVALGEGDARRIMRVVKMRDGELTLAEHNEAGNLKARDADKTDSFKYFSASTRRLISEKARKVQVTPDGGVRDPGPLV